MAGSREIEEIDNAADDPSGAGILDGDAVDEGAVKITVGGDEGGGRELSDLFESIIERGGRQGGVEAGEGGAQAGGEEHLVERGALGVSASGVDVFTVSVGVAEAGEPVNGSLLDDGFGQWHYPSKRFRYLPPNWQGCFRCKPQFADILFLILLYVHNNSAARQEGRVCRGFD